MREFEVVFVTTVEVETLGELHDWMNDFTDMDENMESSYTELFDDEEDDELVEDDDGIEMDDNSL